MSSRRTLLKSATALVAASMLTPGAAWADEPIPVVATFSILGDMVARIGGEHIALTTLVGPGGDAHVYQPTPQAAAAVAGAEVLFINGLEFEGWLERLAEAASFDGELIEATVGVDAIEFGEHDEHDDHAEHGHDDHDDHGAEEVADDDHDHDHDHDEEKVADDHDDHDHDDHGAEEVADDDHDHDHDHGEEKVADDDHDHDHGEEMASKEHDDHGHDDHAGHDHGAFDPHAWQAIENAVIYVDNIAAGLAKVDPENASTYYANRAAYVAELEALETEIDAMMASIPEEKRTIVTSHDAFGYMGAHYGLTFEAPVGMSTESEASAADVAALITQIREEEISAVFVETITDNRLIEQIAAETGAVVGGTLYSDALSGPDGPASTYVDMMRHNAMTLSEALGPQG
ncbi:MAG: zinc ABC transporter substrate-binding protein [Pseudomonadota bacterium]